MKSNSACSICKKDYPSKKLTIGELLRPNLLDFILKQNPDFAIDKLICTSCLDKQRSEYIIHLLKEDRKELSKLDREVARSIREHETISENIWENFEGGLRLSERISDRMAEFGGSWGFIIIFALVIAAWIIVNVYFLSKPMDPFPFILLNLALSCLAAIQAPIIMMSQKRQEDRDRLRSQYDYQINLKAELEIQHLNEKLDLLIKHQWQNLIKIQEIQTDILQEIREK